MRDTLYIRPWKDAIAAGRVWLAGIGPQKGEIEFEELKSYLYKNQPANGLPQAYFFLGMHDRVFILAIPFFLIPIFAQQKGASPLSISNLSRTSKTYAVVVAISDYKDKAVPDLDDASSYLGNAELFAAEGKTADSSAKAKATSEAIGYQERAIGKGSAFEQPEKDEDLAPLRVTPEWKGLMKKHFPEKIK